MSYFSTITQSVVASASNNSTANLASLAAFTGTGESTLSVAGIQVNFKADQKCTIQVQQSDDNTNWDISDNYIVDANTGDARTVQATASFFRVIATNNGGSSTTFLRLQVALCPIVEAVPRALTSLGNFKVSIAEVSTSKMTYSAATGSFTPPATPTDMFIINGSATKTIKISQIIISTTQTTAGVNVFFVVKRSTANTGGTSVSETLVPYDSQDTAATGTAKHYTANPTVGTAVGTIRSPKLWSADASGANSGMSIYTFDFQRLNEQGMTLRGVAEGLAVNFNGAALPAGLSVNISVTWTEEN